MSSFLERGSESVRHERAIAALTYRTDASLEDVRSLFTSEFARLKQTAKVHTYLQILATSNVHEMLRRAGKIPPIPSV